ncbi:MAG: putative Oar protein [Acidobacteriaceae bacterium]|nr:putative Oar protein [Acidobacteriaceae bacterium]
MRHIKSFVLLCVLLAGGIRAFAQADQGAITGLIQDQTGAVIANADVKLTNVDTGLTLQTQTDSGGNYVFSPIKIGSYKVAVTAPGFSTTTQENIQLHVQDRIAVNIALKAGETNTSITVTEAPPLLQTEEGSTGQVIESKTINNTPLNGRNWVFIAQLTAGVAPGNGARGQKGGDFNANGQRAEQNNYIMDGVDNNVNVVDFFNGASYVVRPPPDALAEFKVQTGSYSSEFGHSAGAVVNASIKSGTNNIHGSFWEYIRNDAFDVREYFQPTNTIAKYRQNQFGATLGFPVIKNRLFFFGDVEANRIVFGQTNGGNSSNFSVPTAKERTGDFSELLNPSLVNGNVVQLYAPNKTANGTTLIANNRLDLAGIPFDPVAMRLLNLFPAPNVGLPGQTYNNFSTQNSVLDNTFQWDVRADWNISSKDQAFGRYSYNHEPSTHPAPLGSVLDGGSFGNTGQLVSLGENFAGSETHVFTPTLTNEFRFGYNYGHYAGLHNNANNSTLASSLGLGGVPFAQNNGGLPFFQVSGLSNFGSPQFYATNEYENVYQILDNVTKVVGSHTLKAGVNIQRIRFSTSQPTQPRGTYNFRGPVDSGNSFYTGRAGVANTGSGIADFITGNMGVAAISNVFTSDDVRYNRAGYIQDDWKASHRLTLNYGIRYDYSTPYLERHDNQAAFVPTSGFAASNSTGLYLIPKSKVGLAIPAKFLSLLAEDHITLTYTDNRYLVNPQKSNFAPRIGFAFKATDKAVIHGGYGIFFGGLESTGYFPNFGENFPFEFDSSYSATGSCSAGGTCPTNGFTLANGLPQVITSPSQPTLRGGQPNVRTPYSQQFNLTVEYGISNTMVASVGYVGAVSRHLQFFPNPNGQTALTPNGFSGYTDASGDKTNPLRPFPHFNDFSYTAYDGSANYNSLQAKLEKRLSGGLSFLTTYTYSHSLDNANTPLGSTNDQGTRSVNILGLRADYGPSGFDVRQRFTINGNYELPFGRGRKYLSHGGPLDYAIGGWSSSFVFRAQTGQPMTIGTNGIANPGGAAYNAIRIGDPYAGGGSANSTNPGITCPTKVRTVTNWYNPCAFSNPRADDIGYSNQKYPDGSPIPNSVTGQAAYAYVGSNRGQVYGPGYERVDASLFKSFATFREQRLQFRADIFNLLNTPAYGNPSTTNISSKGGLITGSRLFQANTPDSRFFQFALKYTY